MKNIVFIALGVAFLFYGIMAYQKSMPKEKNERIYQAIKKYSPYYLEKRFGGLQIRSKEDENFKEKPDNMEVFHRMDKLEQDWAKDHLKLNGDIVTIYDKHGNMSGTIKLRTSDEKEFVHTFYGL